jgi:hypothetical protein
VFYKFFSQEALLLDPLLEPIARDTSLVFLSGVAAWVDFRLTGFKDYLTG